ncbi:substrate-binding domain-containing protein [Jannaschia sp. Os4]|uniref:substrate-binding domain-containing protein n=1 Tax=Jannaschia sp. Os4 TaxID=2807617 RepID=UPI001939DAD2|nr:substrate-binding domain-containing protein [Jannaschia sp. Os4]MBM2575468.1 substrate-binding domain-containing protein [Jannaschia sp. Os4]
MIRLLLLLLLLLAPPARAETLRLAVTTSFDNSGLADHLRPLIRADTGLDLQLLVVGTGQALRLARAGDVDAALVHAPDAERAFVAEGHATRRTPVMSNDFLIVGPADDPAGAADAPTASGALRAIATARAPFVSRGDDSGTHKAEMRLWAAAGLAPEGAWYRATGSGMGAALNTARAMGAYVLTDRGSWLAFGNRDGMAVLSEGDPLLHNQYSFLPVNPERHPHVAAEVAARLEAWLVSARGQAAIDAYEVGGEAPFTANARP